MSNILNSDQKYGMDMLLNGNNLFITGNAGTGKSFLIREIIKELENANKNVMIVAPTGIAAINIEGVTIHRAFKAPVEPLIDRPSSATKLLLSIDTLICDEISMCRIDLFEYMMFQVVCANMHRRKNGKQDIQIIVVGDFFQLPPVITPRDKEALIIKYPDIDKGYAFQSPYWDVCNFTPIVLKQLMRQSDSEFINNLNRARIGDKSCIHYFNKTSSKIYDSDAITVVGTNKRAEEINNTKLAKLNGRSYIKNATVVGEVKASDRVAPDSLELKVGARVLMLINDSEDRFCNGSFGYVRSVKSDMVMVDIDNYEGNPVSVPKYKWKIMGYEIENGKLKRKEVGSFEQFPMKLGWAITIHKSQGQTYDKVNIEPKCWDYGQLYVALSRCKYIDTMHLMSNIMESSLVTSREVKNFYRTL